MRETHGSGSMASSEKVSVTELGVILASSTSGSWAYSPSHAAIVSIAVSPSPGFSDARRSVEAGMIRERISLSRSLCRIHFSSWSSDMLYSLYLLLHVTLYMYIDTYYRGMLCVVHPQTDYILKPRNLGACPKRAAVAHPLKRL